MAGGEKLGIPCLANSIIFSTGNCVSGYGTPNDGPKRNPVQANSALVQVILGSALGGSVPARTLLKTVTSNPDRPLKLRSTT